MEFVSMCLNELMKAERGTAKIYGEKTYFSLTRMNCLSSIIKNIGAIGDLVITPYYLFDGQILELYDYTLSIRVVVQSVRSKEEFFLAETGKSNINEIDTEILEKLDNTYYEVLEGDHRKFLRNLERYLVFMSEKENSLLNKTRNELNIPSGQLDGIFYELI